MGSDVLICPDCGFRTRHREDVKAGYCPFCHWWTSDPELGPARRTEFRGRGGGWHDYLTDCDSWRFEQGPPFIERCAHGATRHLPIWALVGAVADVHGDEPARRWVHEADPNRHLRAGAGLTDAERRIAADRVDAFLTALHRGRDR